MRGKGIATDELVTEVFRIYLNYITSIQINKNIYHPKNCKRLITS